MLGNCRKLNHCPDWTLDLPLYLSDEDINAFSREDVSVALWAIKLHAADMAVTPALALRLIHQYLLPLIPPEHWHELKVHRAATWDGIFFIYVALGFCVTSNEDPLVEVMYAIKLIHAHTKRQPREFEFPTVIEVTEFLAICQRLNIPVQGLRLKSAHKVDPMEYCTLCWRHPLPGRKLCAHHAPNSPFQDDGREGAKGAAARYKAGMRQKKRFDLEVNRLLTTETIEHHESLFTTPILLPSQNIAQWLSSRRPQIWQLLAERQLEVTDDKAIRILLDQLHSSEGLPPNAYSVCHLINQHLLEHPQLLWPMLIRAEGWLASREQLRAEWGGKREGAGRLPKPSV